MGPGMSILPRYNENFGEPWRGRQINFPLDFTLQEVKAENAVTLPLDKDLYEMDLRSRKWSTGTKVELW